MTFKSVFHFFFVNKFLSRKKTKIRCKTTTCWNHLFFVLKYFFYRITNFQYFFGLSKMICWIFCCMLTSSIVNTKNKCLYIFCFFSFIGYHFFFNSKKRYQYTKKTFFHFNKYITFIICQIMKKTNYCNFGIMFFLL